MICLHVLSHLSNPAVPEFWEVDMILLLCLQAMAVQIDQVSEGWEDINWVPSYDNHSITVKGFRVRDILRFVCLGDPDSVRIADDVLAQQAHHSFMEGVVNAHVSTGENASDPLDIPSKESVATPWERLEGDSLASLVNTWIKEGAFIILSQLRQLAVIFIIALAKKECF